MDYGKDEDLQGLNPMASSLRGLGIAKDIVDAAKAECKRIRSLAPLRKLYETLEEARAYDKRFKKKMSYVVMNEDTLGFIRPGRCEWLEVLAGSVKGGFDPKDGPVLIMEGVDSLRPATKADFDIFRVDSKGRIE